MSRPSWKYKLFLLFVFYAVYSFFYLLPNLRPFFPPTQLSMLEIDQVVPLIPWTFVVYISDYLLVLVAIIIISDMDVWHSYARMSFAALVICQ